MQHHEKAQLTRPFYRGPTVGHHEGDPSTVIFDGQIFALQAQGGISRYVTELARALGAHNIETHIASTGNDLSRSRDPKQGHVSSYVGHRIGRVARLVTATIELNKHSAHIRDAIVHRSYYARLPLKRRPLAVTGTVHDLVPELFRTGSKFLRRMRQTWLRQLDHIFCVSESTKSDLLAFYDVTESQITVTPLGYNSSIFRPRSDVGNSTDDVATSQVYGHSDPYVLIVGSRRAHKNFSVAATVMGQVMRKCAALRLVITGGGSLDPDELSTLRRAGVALDRVESVTSTDSELVTLYQSALCLFYPSLYEGFGLPVLEAMASGCPVVCSNTGSLPEVTGLAASTVNPTDVDGFSDAIHELVQSRSVRAPQIALGLTQSLKFSWDHCAEMTAGAYRNLIGER